MARKQQKLINYHSSGTSATNPMGAVISNLDYGEIAVRTNPNEPKLYIRTGENTYAVFLDSSATLNLITAHTDGAIEAIASDLAELSGSTSAFIYTVVTDYATKDYANSVSAKAYNDATANTETVSGYIATYIYETLATSADVQTVNNSVNNVANNLAGALATVNTFSASVYNNYAKHAEVGTASASAVTVASKYTDKVSGDVATYIYETLATSASVKTVSDRINNVANDLAGASATVNTFSGSIITYVDDKLSTVYKFKGSVATYEVLPSTGNKIGDVYNVVSAHGTTAETEYTPAGTNYAWNGTSWDALGGTLDLSNYVTNADFSDIRDDVNDIAANLAGASATVNTFSASVYNDYATKDYANSVSAKAYNDATANTETVSGYIATYIYETLATSADVQTVNNSVNNVANNLAGALATVNTFSASVYNNYAKHAEVGTASASAVTVASKYTDKVSGDVATYIYETLATSASVKTVSDKLNEVDGDLEELSASTITIESTANSALQSFKLGTLASSSSTQSGAKAGYTAGGAATLDLTYLVIDCGDF